MRHPCPKLVVEGPGRNRSRSHQRLGATQGSKTEESGSRVSSHSGHNCPKCAGHASQLTMCSRSRNEDRSSGTWGRQAPVHHVHPAKPLPCGRIAERLRPALSETQPQTVLRDSTSGDHVGCTVKAMEGRCKKATNCQRSPLVHEGIVSLAHVDRDTAPEPGIGTQTMKPQNADLGTSSTDRTTVLGSVTFEPLTGCCEAATGGPPIPVVTALGKHHRTCRCRKVPRPSSDALGRMAQDARRDTAPIALPPAVEVSMSMSSHLALVAEMPTVAVLCSSLHRHSSATTDRYGWAPVGLPLSYGPFRPKQGTRVTAMSRSFFGHACAQLRQPARVRRSWPEHHASSATNGLRVAQLTPLGSTILDTPRPVSRTSGSAASARIGGFHYGLTQSIPHVTPVLSGERVMRDSEGVRYAATELLRTLATRMSGGPLAAWRRSAHE